MSGTRTLVTSSFTAIMLAITTAETYGESLEPLHGTWQVVAAHLDETLTRTPNYSYNDPRLVGRVITISPLEITTDFPENSHCSRPIATRSKSKIDDLIDSTMGKVEVRSGPGHRRFEIPVEDDKDLNVWWVTCGNGDIGPDTPFGPEGRNWLTLLSNNQVAIRWYDNTILRLKKLPLHPKPQPSFACKHVNLASEQAICSSYSLSSFDQSVSRTFSRLVKTYRSNRQFDQLRKLQTSQQSWMSRRNDCGGDIQCLKKVMQQRLEELVQM